MIARFFIDRPIFATVLSVAVTLAGALSISSLPVSQYPKVTPPTIQIDCNYPGASAQVVSETIAAPVEQQVNGVEDMLYMTSQSTSDGTYTLTVTFKPGTDLNLAQVRVQNRVNLAFPQLPEVVRATGITTRKRSPELLMTVGITSPPEPGHPEGRYNQLYLSNYAVLKLREELQRLPGISDVTIFGQRDYALRIWLDPDRLAALNLTAADVLDALRQQNLPAAIGQVGQPPTGSGQGLQVTLSMLGRLVEVEEFEKVVVKTGPDGQLVRIKDVVRLPPRIDGSGLTAAARRLTAPTTGYGVELGAKSHDIANRFDDKPTVGLAIFVLPESNAIETADAVKSHMAKASKDFPPGIMYEIGYDTSPFIRESINEVFKSLRDAVILVAVVVLVFLQTWRAAVIPLAAVPVAIVGTFGAMALAGFTINNLTLFGLVLAVGIVVDDAIVVVEAVQHHLEKGLSPRDATIRAMEEVSGPIVAVGVVLGAVFLPCAFLSGIVGSFFRQFALTIAVSTLISTVNSLTLSPALCAILLKRPSEARAVTRAGRALALLLWPLTALGNLFNRAFARANSWYVKLVGLSLRVPLLVLVGYAGIVAAGVAAFRTQPTGFIPQQDKGYMICSVQLPDAASAERTREVISKVSRIALETELDDGEGNKVRPIRHVNAVAGNSFVVSAYGSNFGSMFVILDGFENRRSKSLGADAIAAELRKRFGALCPEAQVQVFGAPAVSGLGRAGGFRIMIEDRGDVGPAALQGQTEEFIRTANQQQQVVGLFTVFKTNSPQLVLAVNVNACLERQVNVGDVYAALQGTMGSRYANDFNRFGRTWQVNIQADPEFRDQVEDVKSLKVRNKVGQMVPLGALLTVTERSGPLVITRYNMYPAAAVNGNVAPGTSTGDATAMLERLAEKQLPDKMAYEWTELTFLEKQSRNTGGLVFGLSVTFVFLILAALYESWAFPLAVILVVPVCVACSLGAVWLTDPGSAYHQVLQWNADPSIPEWLKLGGGWLSAGGWLDRAVIEPLNAAVLAAGIGKQDVNVFTQVGFVVLVGLACKNAILIVEFAKHARDNGADLRTAILDACALRFRPIMMTSIAFMLGVVPLAIARGAGAEMRQALGIAVLGGMLGVTAFGIFLTPVFFALVDRFTRLFGALRARSRAARAGLIVLDVAAQGALIAALEFGAEALVVELLLGLGLVLLGVLLGMLILAGIDTAEAVGGAARAVGRPVVRLWRGLRAAGGAVRNAVRPGRRESGS